MSTLAEQLAAKQAAQIDAQVPDENTIPDIQPQSAASVEVLEGFYRTTGRRIGYQVGNAIVRCDALGLYAPQGEEQVAYFEKLAEQGLVTKG